MTPTEIVDASIAAIDRGDIPAAIAMVTDDVSHENMPIPPMVGPEAMTKTLEMFLGPVTDVDWHIISQVEIGNIVINERLDRFHIGDGWLELPVAGFFEITDGLISLWRDYFDMTIYMSQLNELTAGR